MLYQLSYTPVGAICLAGVRLMLGRGDGKAVLVRAICYNPIRAQPAPTSAGPRPDPA